VPQKLFLPSEFVPTKFSTAADKADFGNTLLRFIESEWKQTAFTKSLYNRLSMCFGHIAHYVEGVIMQSVDTKTAQTRRRDAKPLRIIPPSGAIAGARSD
jgi:hypothetical protein